MPNRETKSHLSANHHARCFMSRRRCTHCKISGLFSIPLSNLCYCAVCLRPKICGPGRVRADLDGEPEIVYQESFHLAHTWTSHISRLWTKSLQHERRNCSLQHLQTQTSMLIHKSEITPMCRYPINYCLPEVGGICKRDVTLETP